MEGSNVTYVPYLGEDGVGGGLNVSDNPVLLANNECIILDNFMQTDTIARRKRPGREAYHTGEYEFGVNWPASGVPIRGGIEFWRYDVSGPTSDLFVHSGEDVYSMDARNTDAVIRTGSLTLSDESVPCYQPFNDTLYFTSSVTADGYNKWDGSSPTAVSATPPADGPGKVIFEHAGRMWMLGNDDFPYRLYYSTAFDPEDWTSLGGSNGGSVDLSAVGDPVGLVGGISYQNRLYAWTKRRLYELTGNDPTTFTLNLISNGIGCVSHKSIVAAGNDVYFASERGYHSLKQEAAGRQSTTDFKSRAIQKMWNNLLNAGLLSQLCAQYDERTNNILLSVPSAGQDSNDQILAFNVITERWALFPNMNARSMWPLIISDKTIVAMGGEDGVISIFNRVTRQDFGAGYSARMKTGVIYATKNPLQELRFHSITVLSSTESPCTFSVSWVIDGIKTGSRTITLDAGEATLGVDFILGQSIMGVGQHVPKTISIDDIGYGIQIEIVQGAESDAEIFGFILGVEELNANHNT